MIGKGRASITFLGFDVFWVIFRVWGVTSGLVAIKQIKKQYFANSDYQMKCVFALQMSLKHYPCAKFGMNTSPDYL